MITFLNLFYLKKIKKDYDIKEGMYLIKLQAMQQDQTILQTKLINEQNYLKGRSSKYPFI